GAAVGDRRLGSAADPAADQEADDQGATDGERGRVLARAGRHRLRAAARRVRRVAQRVVLGPLDVGLDLLHLLARLSLDVGLLRELRHGLAELAADLLDLA